jgi:hypothetical protein
MHRVKPSYLNKIIDARYRSRGRTVNWLLFGKEEEPWDPALAGVSPWIRIEQDDRVLSAGVSFKTHCRERRYAKPWPILKGLPALDTLVIGGFHQDDCVAKFAKAAYHAGIPVSVDEDTTQWFFRTTCRYGKIPLRRRKPWPRAENFDNPATLELIRSYRKTQPWLTQF